MTPEEKAVIEQAIRWSRTETVGQAEDASEALQDIVATLLASRTVKPTHAGADGSCPDYGNTLDPCPTGCASGTCVAGLKFKQEMAALESNVVPEWVPATFIDCLAGDHIRLGDEETDVLRASSGIWHADTSDAWHPKAWKHTELRMELAAVPGFVQYPPNTACEILCTPERKAVLTMQSAFPGSAVVSSDVD